jgi:hypothetical protein
VIPAAVTNFSGMTRFWRDLNQQHSDSSSLAELSATGKDILTQAFTPIFVPCVSFSSVIDSLPHGPKFHLKTDMQGQDFHAVSSAGGKIRRFSTVYSEVYTGDYNAYSGPSNSFENDWQPFMSTWGFEFMGEGPVEGRPGEFDALWVRIDSPSYDEATSKITAKKKKSTKPAEQVTEMQVAEAAQLPPAQRCSLWQRVSFEIQPLPKLLLQLLLSLLLIFH